MPIVIYRKGVRYVVAEAMVEVDDDVETKHDLEINITEPQLTMIQDNTKHYSLGKDL